MFTARALTRAAAPLRTPVARQAIQKRFAHAEVKLPAGVQDNAFNRERQAVKDHAAATSGMLRLSITRENEYQLIEGQTCGASFPSSMFPPHTSDSELGTIV